MKARLIEDRMGNFQKTFLITMVGTAMLISVLRFSQATPSLKSIPEYPNSQRLCSEHVSGEKMHILWRSFASRDPMTTVTAFFEKKLNAKAATGEHNSMKIVDPGDADWTVTIYPKQSQENFPHCSEKPGAEAETVILVSQAIRG